MATSHPSRSRQLSVDWVLRRIPFVLMASAVLQAWRLFCFLFAPDKQKHRPKFLISKSEWWKRGGGGVSNVTSLSGEQPGCVAMTTGSAGCQLACQWAVQGGIFQTALASHNVIGHTSVVFVWTRECWVGPRVNAQFVSKQR